MARLRHWILQTIFELSRVGARRGWRWLTYHPGVFFFFHWLGRREAPKIGESLLETFPEAVSFADVGAGTGPYAGWLKRHGKRAVACEHSRIGRALARLEGVKVVPFDLKLRQPAPLTGPVDVAYSFEVAEHVPPELGRRLVEFLLELAPTVVFSAAHPGQGGQGHINEQPREYWADEFARAGARLDRDATAALVKRVADRDTVWWVVQNTQVFARDPAQEERGQPDRPAARGNGERSGEGGIRTPDGLKAHTGFRDRRIQPLCHLSG